MRVLLDDQATSSTDAVTSLEFRPQAGAVSNAVTIYSSGVAGTADVEVNLGGSTGWVTQVSAEAVTAGEALTIVLDIPELPHRVVITPGAATASTWRIVAGSNGQP